MAAWHHVRVLTRRPILTISAGLAIIATVLGYLAFRDDSPGLIHYPATWSARATTPDATGVVLDMNPSQCADQTLTRDRLAEPPKVEYGPDTITISVTAQITRGIHTCGRRVPDQVVVHLQEPIGNRTLVDGNAGASP